MCIYILHCCIDLSADEILTTTFELYEVSGQGGWLRAVRGRGSARRDARGGVWSGRGMEGVRCTCVSAENGPRSLMHFEFRPGRGIRYPFTADARLPVSPRNIV